MNTSISHLPQHKQAQLQRVVQTVLEVAQPEMIILFGSHATGKWVETRHMEGHALHEYISDYDIPLFAVGCTYGGHGGRFPTGETSIAPIGASLFGLMSTPLQVFSTCVPTKKYTQILPTSASGRLHKP